jgi:hypothetical protein
MWSSWNGLGGGSTKFGINLDGRHEVLAVGPRTDSFLNQFVVDSTSND